MAENIYRLVTNNFKNYSVNQFIESVTEPANSIFYVFVAKNTPYSSGDTNVPVPNNSVQTLNIDTYKEMILGKQITSADVKAMVKRYDWTSGTVYDQYSHNDGNLSNYFVVIRSGGNYYVFKCLFNNNGAPSTVQPDFNETSADDVLYETSDGYQWKYLYTISKAVFDKFSTTEYIPVVPDSNVSSNAVSGAIDVITVTSNGTGYNHYFYGQFGTTDIAINGNTLVYNIGSTASTANDYYTHSVIKIVEGKGQGEFKKINAYRVINNTKQIVVNGAFSSIPDATSRYEISPLILVTGDGKQTASCEARALVNAAASNSVYKVEILNRGVGYSFASANVILSPVVSVVDSAVLNVVIPPVGGHGAYVDTELNATNLGISVDLANNENGTILTGNDYRKIGIIKDPRFSNVGLTVSNISGTFTPNETLYQLRRIRVEGFISINTTSNTITSNSINFQETFKPNDKIFISDEKGNEISSVIVTVGGSSYVSGEPLTFSGGGGSNAAGYVLATNGAINAVKLKSITSVSMLTAGAGFTGSTQSVTLTGATSGASSAIGTATISAGGVSSVLVTDGGSGYTSGETVRIKSSTSTTNGTATATITAIGSGFVTGQAVSIYGSNSTVSTATGIATACSGALTAVSVTDSSSCYVENEILQISSSTSTVNATATADTANGVIKSILISNPGVSYTSAPTIGVTSAAGSGASLTPVVNTTPVSGRRMLTTVSSISSASSMTLSATGLFQDSTASIYFAELSARGTIDTFDVDLIQVQNSVGQFTTGGFVVGNTSLASANINSYQISQVTKPYTTFVQTNRYDGTSTGISNFIEDELLTQDTAGAFVANASLHTANVLNNTLYVTEEQGNFLVANVIVGSTSGAELTINNIYKGDLVPWSGDVMYIQNLEPISRSEEQTETIKIILEF